MVRLRVGEGRARVQTVKGWLRIALGKHFEEDRAGGGLAGPRRNPARLDLICLSFCGCTNLACELQVLDQVLLPTRQFKYGLRGEGGGTEKQFRKLLQQAAVKMNLNLTPPLLVSLFKTVNYFWTGIRVTAERTTSPAGEQFLLTSCLLISLVEKVPFWCTSSVSDHSMLFLLLGGVGAGALLQGLWGTPGDLPSPRNEACAGGGRARRKTNEAPRPNRGGGGSVEVKLGVAFFSTWMVWPKRRTAPFFTGEMRLANDVTLPRGRTRLVLGSWKGGQERNSGF